MASRTAQIVGVGASAAVVLIALGVPLANRSTDECSLVQAVVSEGNRVALVDLGMADVVPDGAIMHLIVCGSAPDGGGTSIPDALVLAPAGTRGLIGLGTGSVGSTGAEVRQNSSGRVTTTIRHSFRCAPDPERPGKLNAACNSECAACMDGQATGILQRARMDALGVVYDCGAWISKGCRGAP